MHTTLHPINWKRKCDALSTISYNKHTASWYIQFISGQMTKTAWLFINYTLDVNLESLLLHFQCQLQEKDKLWATMEVRGLLECCANNQQNLNSTSGCMHPPICLSSAGYKHNGVNKTHLTARFTVFPTLATIHLLSNPFQTFGYR